MDTTSERLVPGSTGSATTAPGSAGKTRRNIIIGVIAAVVVVLGVLMAWNGSNSADAKGLVFTIPEGTYKTISTPGIDTAVTIPTKIEFEQGDGAKITIINNDIVDHRAGPFLVGAGQTYTQPFPKPGEYQINCSVDPAESVTVTVKG